MNLRRNRLLGLASAIAFLISSVFPIVAGVTKDTSRFPKAWGVFDVTLAALLALLTFGIMGIGRKLVNQQVQDTTYRTYRVLIHAIFAMLVVFFVAGDRIKWIQCLTGFAWRAWLLIYALPEWIAVMGYGQIQRTSARTETVR